MTYDAAPTHGRPPPWMGPWGRPRIHLVGISPSVSRFHPTNPETVIDY